MKQRIAILWGLSAAALCVAAGPAGIEERGTGDAVAWLTSYQTAQAAARQSGKPIFAVFR